MTAAPGTIRADPETRGAADRVLSDGCGNRPIR